MTDNTPKMMTIKEIAKTGLLPEHTLREMNKQGLLPAIYVGKSRKAIINYDLLIKRLNALGGAIND